MQQIKKRFYFSLLSIFLCLATLVVLESYQLYALKLMTFDAKLKEVSGLEYDKKGRLWAINDGGDQPRLYQVNADGSIARTIKLSNAKNQDWEDMTQDSFGHFYIGDFGNNDKARRWLTIYKIRNPIYIKGNSTSAEIIKFTYSDLALDDDVKSTDDFDLEAFIHWNRKLYLFTKNRDTPFDGNTHVYRIGDYAANFKAEYVSSFKTCISLQELCWITSAALSPNGKRLVLLDSERIWLFENWQKDDFFSGDVYKIKLGIVTQKEAITFIDNQRVIFTDEEFNGIGRNAYVVDLETAKKERVATSKTNTVVK